MVFQRSTTELVVLNRSVIALIGFFNRSTTDRLLSLISWKETAVRKLCGNVSYRLLPRPLEQSLLFFG
jgi:hypothetical protein